MTELEDYLKLRGKQLKENQEEEADETCNLDKIKGRRKELERVIEKPNNE